MTSSTTKVIIHHKDDYESSRVGRNITEDLFIFQWALYILMTKAISRIRTSACMVMVNFGWCIDTGLVLERFTLKKLRSCCFQGLAGLFNLFSFCCYLSVIPLKYNKNAYSLFRCQKMSPYRFLPICHFEVFFLFRTCLNAVQYQETNLHNLYTLWKSLHQYINTWLDVKGIPLYHQYTGFRTSHCEVLSAITRICSSTKWVI